MLIKCNKILSPISKKDLGAKSPWLIKDNLYVVLALDLSRDGLQVFIKTEMDNESRFTSMVGFEVISQHIPSSWITVIDDKQYLQKTITMLPKSWAYDSFFEDLLDEKTEAVALYHEEAQLIVNEEARRVGWVERSETQQSKPRRKFWVSLKAQLYLNS